MRVPTNFGPFPDRQVEMYSSLLHDRFKQLIHHLTLQVTETNLSSLIDFFFFFGITLIDGWQLENHYTRRPCF